MRLINNFSVRYAQLNINECYYAFDLANNKYKIDIFVSKYKEIMIWYRN